MFRRVIIGVDGRPNGRDAVMLGLHLVDHDGRIALAHVCSGERVPARGSNLEFDRVQREESEALLARERDALGVEADLLTVSDPAVGRGLHRLATEREADLLVVGCSHRGTAGRVMLGDDARGALTESPCAVAVAPAGYARSARPFGTVGVAYDMSAQSRMALTVARGLAVREHASVRALRVLGYPVTPYMSEAPSMWKESSEAELKAARQALDLPADVDGDVVMGRVQDELETFSGQVDALVVGSRDRGPVRRAVLGSTAQHLARHARCPLIVVAHGVPESLAAAGPDAAAPRGGRVAGGSRNQ